VVPAGIIPLITSIGVVVKEKPLQVVEVIGEMEGTGSTVTVNVKVAPAGHPAIVGVTVYVAVWDIVVKLVKVPIILAAGTPLATPPVIPPVTIGAVHVYIVPAGTTPFVTSTGVDVKAVPPHVTAVIGVTTGIGFTVTVNVKVAPAGQPATVGVTVYVAVCELLVAFVKVPVILAAGKALATPPVMPPVTDGAVQVYVVPAGTIPLVPLTGVDVKAILVHVITVIGVITGTEFTVTVTVKVGPGQPPTDGVTV
jgi:hypothetical protein